MLRSFASKVIPRPFCLSQIRFLGMEQHKPLNFIDGRRILPLDTSGEAKNFNPATGSLLCSIACSGYKEVERAVNSSRKAFPVWSKLSPQERGRFLVSAAQNIRSRVEEIAQIEVSDTGKPIWEAKVDITGCADVLEYYGGIAPSIKGHHHPLADGSFAVVQREALGVVAGIGAWNYPFQVMTWKAAPALICGNTFIYKPSQFTPLTSVILAEIFADVGIPPGVVNVVQGDGATGEALCSHLGVAKVSFTGSVETGKKIVKSCADTMKKVTMELGGKSALIVFDDSDIVNAVKATLLGNFLTQGEVCSNCTRVFVQRTILEDFQNQLVSATKKMKIGDPTEESTTVGAVINENHGQKILDYVASARQEGAVIACGGERVVPENSHLKGCFISPCVITDCTDNMKIVQEEVFGPVVSVLPFDSEEEAVQRANSSPYGLAAGVMTKDIQRAHRVASALQAGIVWINNYNVFPPEVPFGGYKMSGFGRENGLAAINDYTQLKTVYVEMNRSIVCPIYTE